jgi:glutamate-1-semialdehyde 2,1-aminomutase
VYPDLKSKSAELFARAQNVMPSGYTRHMVVSPPYPIYADHAEGCWITDVDGNRYIDFVNNFTALIHGHGRKEIVDVVSSQAHKLMSAILPCEAELQLAELLQERIPGVELVRFMNSGTEAVMIAVKAARAYTQRSKIAKMEGGYHGQYDLIEISHRPPPNQWGPADHPASVGHQFATPQSLLDEVVVMPTNDIETTRQLISENASELAAVLIDPYRIHLGNIEPNVEYLQMLREETSKHGIVLIFDEVMCLRVGYHGRQGQLGITPDLTTMGKIIGGGLPVGGLGGTREMMSVFELDGMDVKVAAGYAGMTLLTPEVFAEMDRKGNRLRDGLNAAIKAAGLAAHAVGEGSLSSIALTEKPVRNFRKLATLFTPEFLQRSMALQHALLNEGVLSMRGMFVASTPMTDDDINFTIEAAGRAFRTLAFQIEDTANG